MNKNTNRWAVKVSDEKTSTTIQQIAFKYGYKWWPDPVMTHDEMVKYLNNFKASYYGYIEMKVVSNNV